MEYKKIGSYIRQVDVRNRDLSVTNLRGVSIEKKFIPSIANIIGTDLSTYKVVKSGQFAYGPVTSRNGEKVSIALLYGSDCIISSSYSVFEVTDTNALDPEYLMLWFQRPEFDRYARFHSHGSVRELFDWNAMCDVEIPFPPIDVQRKLVYDYKVISDRIALKRRINENLEAIIQSLFDTMYYQAGINLPETIIQQNEIPSDWISTQIGKHASVQTGPFGSQLHNEDYVQNGTPIITVEHLDGKYIAHRNLPQVSNEDYIRLSKYDLRTGDIVFSRVGSVDRASIVSNYENGWLFSGRCLRVRPHESDFAIYFLWWFNQSVIKQLVSASAVGATMPSINTKILSEIRLILPPDALLVNFCDKAKVIIKSVWQNNEEIRKLQFMQEFIKASMSH